MDKPPVTLKDAVEAFGYLMSRDSGLDMLRTMKPFDASEVPASYQLELLDLLGAFAAQKPVFAEELGGASGPFPFELVYRTLWEELAATSTPKEIRHSLQKRREIEALNKRTDELRRTEMEEEIAQESAMTDRPCPYCGRPALSYRKTCKYCGQSLKALA
jgi:hypothetical protein